MSTVNFSSAMPTKLLAWHLYCPWSYLVKLLMKNVPVSASIAPVDRFGWNHFMDGNGSPVILHCKVKFVVRLALMTLPPIASTQGGSKYQQKYLRQKNYFWLFSSGGTLFKFMSQQPSLSGWILNCILFKKNNSAIVSKLYGGE